MLPLSGGKLPGRGSFCFARRPCAAWQRGGLRKKLNYQQEGSLNGGDLFHPTKTGICGQNGILLYQWTNMTNKNCHLLGAFTLLEMAVSVEALLLG